VWCMPPWQAAECCVAVLLHCCRNSFWPCSEDLAAMDGYPGVNPGASLQCYHWAKLRTFGVRNWVAF
jgi:hypothetical protein